VLVGKEVGYSMLKFSVKVKSVQRIPELKLTDKQSKLIGNTAIHSLIDRVQNENTDIHGRPFPEYSNRPVYVKLGKSGGTAVIKSGRIPIASLSALKRAGAKIIDGSKSIKKQGRKQVVRSGNSLRFANRSEYKKFLGKSGRRDLTDTGAMLDAIVVTNISGVYAKVITIGFKNPMQEAKARGNVKWIGEQWAGLSPIEQIRISRMVEDIFAKNLGLRSDAAPRSSSFHQQVFVPTTTTGYSEL
jgi:hypothetical protein